MPPSTYITKRRIEAAKNMLENTQREPGGIEREKENPRKDYEKFSDIKPLILFFFDDHYKQMVDNALVYPEHLNKEDIKNLFPNVFISCNASCIFSRLPKNFSNSIIAFFSD